MDIEKLKKLNSDPKELEAPAQFVLTGLESTMKELLAEQMIMNSRRIADQTHLTKRLEEVEKAAELVGVEAEKSREADCEIIFEAVGLAHQVKAIPLRNRKERTKQY